jgi:peptide/nickel transport system permease protein
VIRFILRKLGYGLLVLWGVITLVFILFNFKPGDPARMAGGQHVTPEVLQAIQRDLNLDVSPWKHYLLFLNELSPVSIHSLNPDSRIYSDRDKYNFFGLLLAGEQRSIGFKVPYLGRSYQSRKKVSEVLAESIPGTFILATVAIVFALIVGIFLGVVSALKKDSWIDRTILVVSVLGMSGPSFFMAIIISWIGGYVWFEQTNLPAFPMAMLLLGFIVFGVKNRSAERKDLIRGMLKSGIVFLGLGLGIWIFAELFQSIFPTWNMAFLTQKLTLPGTGLSMTGSLFTYGILDGRQLALQNLILPALTLGIRPLSVVIQLMRNSLLDVMGQDFIRTAYSKGLSTAQVIWRHAIRNALNPVITAVSGWFASMLAGAVFIEFVFGWKGLGLAIFQALTKDDLPIVMGGVLVIAVIFVGLNILVDIIYGWLDPRVRIQ